MLLTLRKLPVIGLSFVHIINSNMRDIHTERTLNIHIYELIKQTLVDTHRKLTKCRESDSTTNHREAWEAPIL
jgi:hypothetical protein